MDQVLPAMTLTFDKESQKTKVVEQLSIFILVKVSCLQDF